MSSDSPYPKLTFPGIHSTIRKWQSCLPHWQCEKSASYFVTFRLADSLPSEELKRWRGLRNNWIELHPQPWSESVELEYHRLFSSKIDLYLDVGHGECLLADPSHADAVAATFTARNEMDYLMHSWIIMPNHVHLLFTLNPEKDLGRIVASWKRTSGTAIHKMSGRSGGLWQRDYFDRIIRDWNHFGHVARYIRNNPIKASLQDHRFRLYESAWIKRLLSTI